MSRFLAFFAVNLGVASATGLALSFAVLSISHSGAGLGTNLAAYYAPSLLAPLIAPFVDRWREQTVLAVTSLARGLAVLTFWVLMESGITHLPIYYALSFVIGLIKLPQGGAFRRAFTHVIPPGRHVQANGRYSAAANISTMAGAGMAGVAVQALGAPSVLLVCALAFMGLTPWAFLAIKGSPAPASVRPGQAAAAGAQVRVTRAQTVLAVASALATAVVVPFTVLTPVIAAQRLHAPAVQGVVMAALTGAAVVTGAVVSRRGSGLASPRGVRTVVVLLAASPVVTTATLAGGSPSAIVLSAAVAGCATTLVEALVYGIFHSSVPEPVQGRFFTNLLSGETLAQAVLFVSLGWLSDRFSPAAGVAVLGIVPAAMSAAMILATAARAGDLPSRP